MDFAQHTAALRRKARLIRILEKREPTAQPSQDSSLLNLQNSRKRSFEESMCDSSNDDDDERPLDTKRSHSSSEDKTNIRMERNRESAARSRARVRERTELLHEQVLALSEENLRLTQRIQGLFFLY